MKVLVVEDDKTDREHIVALLRGCGQLVDVTENLEDAMRYLKDFSVDVVLLDTTLDGKSGAYAIESLRRQKVTVPLFVISSEWQVEHKVACLDAGADDYLTKPFEPEEMFARLRALVRRKEHRVDEVLRVGELTIDPTRHLVLVRGKSTHFTRTEFKLLTYLARSPGRILSRDMALDVLYEHAENIPRDERTVDCMVKKVRAHLRNAGLTKQYIHSIYGVGYKLEVPRSRAS